MTRPRYVQRKLEASVGSALFQLVEKNAMNKSQLIEKTIYLPKFGVPFTYLEREARTSTSPTNKPTTTPTTTTPLLTLVFFHGLSEGAKQLALFISSLDVPDHVRILAPNQMGHGMDLERAKTDPDHYQHPTPRSMLQTTTEFLDMMDIQSPCHAFGISLGGAVAYYVQHARPHLIQKAVLVSPAIEYSLDEDFVMDFATGTKNHMCFQSRDDVKILFRETLGVRASDHKTKKNKNKKTKDPIPKFFYEPIFRTQQKLTPPGHYQTMLEGLLEHHPLYQQHAPRTQTTTPTTTTTSYDEETRQEYQSLFGSSHDVAPDLHRYILWPQQDAICNYEKGREFFANANPQTTTFQPIPKCGHVFAEDGRFILDVIREPVRAYLMKVERTNDIGNGVAAMTGTPTTSDLKSTAATRWKPTLSPTSSTLASSSSRGDSLPPESAAAAVTSTLK